MKHITIILGLCLGWGTTAAWAQDLWQQLLPPSEVTQQVLLDSPFAQSARFKKEAQQSRAQTIALGPHEFSVRLNQQARRVSSPYESFPETTIHVERPVRWWGKSEIDEQLATQSRELARIAYSDALHEASRLLLGHWMTALRAQAVHANAVRDWELAGTLQRQAGLRWKQGDISELDAQLATAEMQRAQAQKDLSASEQKRALAMLASLYPGLPPPRSLPSTLSLPDIGPHLTLRAAFLAKHHELNWWRAEAERSATQARKSDKDRVPDPTLGVFTSRERMGAERVVGVNIGIPLPGQARQRQADAARFDALAAQDKVRQLELELGADFDQRWHSVQDLRQALGSLNAALAIQQGAADKSMRAYALGEGSMSDVIQQRRLANEQHRRLHLLQLDIVEHMAFIRLDLHELWDFD